jgi:hypothetical protein
MNCSKCGEVINPISGINYGTIERPICEKCNSIQGRFIPESTHFCANHPKVKAEYICRMCGAHICKTCVFEFDNNVLLCPNCVNKPQPLSVNQKKLLNWSYIMAVIATFGYIILFFLAAINPSLFKEMQTEKNNTLLGWGYFIFIVVPPFVGLSKGKKARFKHQKNPASIKIALIWNISLIGFFLLSIIMGIVMRIR